MVEWFLIRDRACWTNSREEEPSLSAKNLDSCVARIVANSQFGLERVAWNCWTNSREWLNSCGKYCIRQAMKKMEKTLKALANRRRLAILKYLKNTGQASVGDIAGKIQLSFKATSKHLNILFGADILEREQKSLMMTPAYLHWAR